MRSVRSIRRHIAVRVVTCFLLTWATADLLVPQLCGSEQVSQESGSPSGPQDRDDCFCCCSHVVKAPIVTVMHSQGVPFGIGVDENTALVVKNGVEASVIGYKGVLIMDISQAIHDPKAEGFNLKNVKLSYLDRGDSINLRTREVTPADEKVDDIKLDPNSDSFDPYFDHRMFYTDILGNCAVADLLGRLIDNKEGEAIGLAFSGLDARHQPSDGYEFKFYRGPDSKGWYTEDFGGEDYTVLDRKSVV